MRKLNVNALRAAIEKREEEDLAAGRVGGVVLRVDVEGEPVYSACFGRRHMDSPAPMTADTAFRMASMTKPITAVALMMLEDRGLLSITDPVSKYLPAFGNLHVGRLTAENTVEDLGPAKTQMTLFHLLTHTSGLGCGELGLWYGARETRETDRTLRASVDALPARCLAFDPFSAQQYSTASFDVMARVIEEVTDRAYVDFIREEITEPLDMKDTTFTPSAAQWARMAGMHDRRDGKSVVGYVNPDCTFEETPVTHPLAGAGIISTVSDYANFAFMLLHEGEFRGCRLLRAETVRRMATPKVPASIMPGPERWGLGMRVITGESYGRLPVGTFGWSGAYGTHFWVDPIDRVTAVYLKNSRFDGGAGAVTANHFEEDVNSAFFQD